MNEATDCGGLSKIDHEILTKTVYGQAITAVALTRDEFASLVTVGNTRVSSDAPAIPAEHSARLIALGYMIYFKGRLLSDRDRPTAMIQTDNASEA
jgi:hypothetical protein